MDGIALGTLALGAVFLWGAIRGKSPLAAFQSLLVGKSPATNPQSNPIHAGAASGTSSGSAAGSAKGSGTVTYHGGAQAALQQAAAQYGWDKGAEWQALNAIEMQEAGYSPTATNPTSYALGLAQALGHGGSNTAGTLGNEYGAQYGLTVAEAKAANSGDALQQARWMVGYIKSRYGDPIAAEKFHLANDWY